MQSGSPKTVHWVYLTWAMTLLIAADFGAGSWPRDVGATFGAVLGRLSKFDFEQRMLCVHEDTPRILDRGGQFPGGHIVLPYGQGNNLCSKFAETKGPFRSTSLYGLQVAPQRAMWACSEDPFWRQIMYQWRATRV